MIILLAYIPDLGIKERKYKRSYNLDFLECQFHHWYHYYRNSGTKMDFRIFTDCRSDLKYLGGFPVTPLKADSPIKTKTLSYADWLRSELFDAVGHKCIYMDLDCIVVNPIDELLEIDKPIAMAKENAGVLVFNRSFKEEFQDRFLKKVLDSGAINNRTGEFIWWEFTQEVGLELKGNIYNLRSFKQDFEGKLTDQVKIIHLINAANVWFFRMHKFFSKVDAEHEHKNT